MCWTSFGFPDSSVGKESACNAGDPGSIPGSGRSTGEGIDCPLQCSSPVAQLVKNLSAVWETWVQSLSWEDPLEKGKVTRSSILPGEFHGLYSTWGRRVGHDWATYAHCPFLRIVFEIHACCQWSECFHSSCSVVLSCTQIAQFLPLPQEDNGSACVRSHSLDFRGRKVIKSKDERDFPGCLVIKNLPSTAGHGGLILAWGTTIPDALGQLSPCPSTAEPARCSLGTATGEKPAGCS